MEAWRQARQVWQALAQDGTLRLADLMAKTGAGRTRVIEYLALLRRLGFVEDAGVAPPTGGRPARLYRATADALITVGVDVGTARTRVLALRGDDTLVFSRQMPTRLPAEQPRIVEALCDTVRGAVEEVPGGRAVAVGVAVSAVVDARRGVCLNFHKLPGWKGLPLREALEKRLQTRIVVEDSSRAQAVAEARWGVGREVGSFLFVNVGMGIGSGIVVDGHLFIGPEGFSGELGHVVVEEGGPLCACGNAGCLEVFASGPAVVRYVREQLSRGRVSELAPLTGVEADDGALEQIVTAASKGSKLAYEALTRAGQYLGRAIASAFNLLGMETAVVGGGVAQAGEPLILAADQTARLRVLPDLSPKVRVRRALVGPLDAAMGAALLARQRYLHEVTWDEVAGSRAAQLVPARADAAG